MADLGPELYDVAWLALLEIEAQATLCMLENRHRGKFPMGRGDDYVSQAGDVCRHSSVIIATIPECANDLRISIYHFSRGSSISRDGGTWRSKQASSLPSTYVQKSPRFACHNVYFTSLVELGSEREGGQCE
jgi:hypothetical protein